MQRGMGLGSGPRSGGKGSGGGSESSESGGGESVTAAAVVASTAAREERRATNTPSLSPVRDNGDGSAGVHVGAPFNPPYVTVEPEVTVTSLHGGGGGGRFGGGGERQAATAVEGGGGKLAVVAPDTSHAQGTRPPSAFVVLASDGLWDLMSSKEAAAIVARGCVNGSFPTVTNAVTTAAAGGEQQQQQQQDAMQRKGQWWGQETLKKSFSGWTGAADGLPTAAASGNLLLPETFVDGVGSYGGSGSIYSTQVAAERKQAERGGSEMRGGVSLEGAAQAVLNEALLRAAREWGMSLEELRRLPPGTTRRQRHDDISVVVAFVD